MLSVAAVATGAKLAAWFLGLVLATIAILAHTGRAAGRAAADRGALIRQAALQREIARADALGPRDRASVLDRLRDGSF